VKASKALLVIVSIGLLPAKHGSAQIYQGGGTFIGQIASVESCVEKDPVTHSKNLSLIKKKSDSCKGNQGANCRVHFDGETTEWRGPDTAIRTIDLSCYYTNADYGFDNATCSSKAEFSAIQYSSLIILPKYAKPLWNLSMDISYSGEHFLNENVFVRVEMSNDTDQSKSITSLILPCDDQNAFSGDSPGEILDMTPGDYMLKIYQPDYAAINDKINSLVHKEGKLFIKYQVMVTGHN
jgi:hypothetical protein